MNQSAPRISTARPVQMARSMNIDGPGSACRAWVERLYNLIGLFRFHAPLPAMVEANA